MNTQKLKRIFNFLPAVLLISFAIYIFYNKYRLKKNFEFTVAQITRIQTVGFRSAGDYSVFFEYSVENHHYSANVDYKYCTGSRIPILKKLLVGKRFPLAYSKENPQAAVILLFQENAEKFRYNLPDSLKRYDSILSCRLFTVVVVAIDSFLAGNCFHILTAMDFCPVEGRVNGETIALEGR